MLLQDILSVKGTTVYTISPDTTLEEAVQSLVRHNIGSLLVCDRHLSDGEQLVGIITERDLLHCVAAGRCDLAAVKVRDVMTTRLITASPTESVSDIMGVMTDHRIRHVPVLNDDRLVGMVSIGDLVKSEHNRLAAENQFMRDYIGS